MDSKELRSLMEAYQQVSAPQEVEEVEQVDEVMKHQQERDRIEKMKKSRYYSPPTKGVHGEIERRKKKEAPAKLRSGSPPEETEAVDEAMSSYDRNRKRAAQRAAERNAAPCSRKDWCSSWCWLCIS